MTRWEYTYVWWEGSTTHNSNGQLGPTTPPIGDEIIDRLNDLATDGWEVQHITAVPLITAWISPRGGTTAAGYTNKVHYLAVCKRKGMR